MPKAAVVTLFLFALTYVLLPLAVRWEAVRNAQMWPCRLWVRPEMACWVMMRETGGCAHGQSPAWGRDGAGSSVSAPPCSLVLHKRSAERLAVDSFSNSCIFFLGTNLSSSIACLTMTLACQSHLWFLGWLLTSFSRVCANTLSFCRGERERELLMTKQ